ncbi:3-oxoacyl-[acyl-carrier-protein] synthase-3 [Amycolatopsis bartoniae]|uniref:3-oxoacyl-ACP synthase n=1 Tax=Amycolatopsis bartoniae TaxID=941986 RepID=A0A8H9ME88_9PSEU|nr:3-oxoacyl-[acyl-carrier-protein] synthase III C-terminal domain-containing protein [Amycolatopsis bartoniae]MBB2938529.1 3-oxoacyl-[acyl-carrier-protein] synthase-3 [Amycolatopsis bartoniae]TVT10330.1 3-oxoacyl-ACP synthase [Amycolatopsis bartoniae]GHF70350.1 3-oxoacyl-ACP synthase [Amycolatopsis bartoniae]
MAAQLCETGEEVSAGQPAREVQTTIEALAAYLPSRSTSLEEVAGPLGLTRAQVKVLQRVYGVRDMRLDPSQSLFDLILPAARAVTKDVADPGSVRYVLYAHATQEVTPSTTDAADVIRTSLGLHDAEAFAITQQNCAAGLAAIDAAGALLAADGDPDARALVVTGEKPFSKLNHDYHSLGSVMGEAASAMLIARGGKGDRVRSYVTRARGEFAAGILMDPETREVHNQAHDPEVCDVIRQAVAEAGLELGDIDRVVHYNSLMLEVSAELGLPRERFFAENLPKYSHCYASDVFVNYLTLRDSGRLRPGHHYLLVATGLGATYSAMVLTHLAGRDGE